jgi:hypothetical protein
MRLEIYATPFGIVACYPTDVGIAGALSGNSAKHMIEADARRYLPHAHVEIESVTVSERRTPDNPVCPSVRPDGARGTTGEKW